MTLQEKIQKTKEYLEKENELLYQLNYLEEKVKEEQQDCPHIEVLLHKGNNVNENVCRCLLCGARQSFLAKYKIDASAYSKEYDTTTYEGCDEKWEWIRVVAQSCLNEHPNLDAEGLTNYMNYLIQESVSYDESTKKELKLNEKIG